MLPAPAPNSASNVAILVASANAASAVAAAATGSTLSDSGSVGNTSGRSFHVKLQSFVTIFLRTPFENTCLISITYV